MKTNVFMERKLFNDKVLQRTDNEFLSATDLIRAGNKYRIMNNEPIFSMAKWFATKSTKEFMTELQKEFGKIKLNSTGGKGKHTWVHPLLFIDLALAISPKLKLEAYKWLYDQLINSRNSSGDSFKRMSGALYIRHNDKYTFHKYITEVSTKIKNTCEVNDWQTATETQLQLRDKIHNNIAILAEVMRRDDDIVRIAMVKSLPPQ